MIVSSRGDAAQISSTLMRPRAVSIWASMPMWPTGRPACCSTCASSMSRATTCAADSTFGQHDLVEARPGVADHLDHVEGGPLRRPVVDPDAQDLVAPLLAADGRRHLAPGRLLLLRRHGVLEVEEHHVGGDAGALAEHLLAGAGDGQAGPAGQVAGALGHARRLGGAGTLDETPRDGSGRRGKPLPSASRSSHVLLPLLQRSVTRTATRSAEQRDGAVPGLLGLLGLVDLGTGVVEEGVVGVLVDEQLHVLAEALERRLRGPSPCRA